ncbi:MAG: DUF512 domain-containing protein [Firmicutes bacterium]|nr:DUF512 domain-containing protein [Bacillota bacterium]
MGKSAGAVVSRVRPGSIAARLGLAPGDRVWEIGGERPRDWIDYRFLTAEPLVEMRVVRPDGSEVVFEVEKDPDEDLGLEFTEDVFGGPDAIRTCENHCLFCFVDRLPRGLRPSLYLKDDDFRLSFLHGNFITLTNLTEEDRDRILGQRLSPLYVSVHATDPEVRVRLMRNPKAGAVLAQLRELTRAGIFIHAQVVVCPGLNDGMHLDRTVADLAALRPNLASIGVVPVGLTRFGPSESPVRLLTREEAAALLEQVLRWHRRLGGFVYPADELFLALGRDVPAAGFYDDFPQLQNGIGLTRMFLDDLARVRRRLARRTGTGPAVSFTVLTGRLAAPLVERAVRVLAETTSFRGQVVPVGNDFFGPAVTVAGLLAGSDLARAALDAPPPPPGLDPGPVVVPGVALRAGTDELLDGATLSELGRRLGRAVLDGGWLPRHLVRALDSWVREARSS